MSVFTVHAPPPRRGEPDGDPTRFAFVRDGFSVWAFLFAPLWMLRHRLWLAFFGYQFYWLPMQQKATIAGNSRW